MRKTVISGLLLLLIQFLVSASALSVAAAQEPDGRVASVCPGG